jgi:uncharacterized protein
MLRRYSFTNFQSFSDTTEVSLLLNQKVQPLTWEHTPASSQRVSTVMGVVGPNGSGKTALLKPLVFLNWFMTRSFHLAPGSPIPVMPHLATPDRPIAFELEGEDDQGIWRYQLTLTAERVLHESLHEKRERFGYVFTRDWSAEQQTYAIRQQNFGLRPSEARKVRPNASLLSTAAQYGVKEVERWTTRVLGTNVNIEGRVPYHDNDLLDASEFFAAHPALRQQMTRLLRGWDLGLEDIELREQEFLPAGREGVVKVWIPHGIHRWRNGTTHALPFWEESSGTRSAFILLSRLLPALTSGGLVVIDEFENDLHPHMLEPILNLFASPRTNPHHAQILFTCHAAEVLNLLHKSQVMLVEKNTDGESTAWRLDSVVGLRNDDNFYAKYMAGAYGAVPQV